jgi:Ca2+-transporting ATPase
MARSPGSGPHKTVSLGAAAHQVTGATTPRSVEACLGLELAFGPRKKDLAVSISAAPRVSTTAGAAPIPAPERVAAPDEPSLREAADLVAALGSDGERGLSVASAAERLQRYGQNELAARPPVPAWLKLLAQFKDPLVYLLLAAVLVSLGAWAAEGAHGVPFDALVVALIVVANAFIGYAQEARAERAVAALQSMVATTVTLVRGGEQRRVPASELVPGDIVLLAEGDAVGADARLLEAHDLQVAEASLTGESVPVRKQSAALSEPAPLAERSNMVYKGTAVTQGVGRSLVVATGMSTEMGRIAELLEQTVEERTPLQREIARVGRILGGAVVVIAVIVVGAVLFESPVDTLAELVSVLLLGVSLAVAAVPEGLPAILSVVLALGVQRMAKQHAIVKKLSSVETLGSASVICSDKTGTLTRNEMTIERALCASGEVELGGSGYRPEGELTSAGERLEAGGLRDELERLLLAGALANNARLEQHGDGWSIQGDPTDGAFIVAERKAGLAELRQRRFRRVGELPFSSERKLMTSLVSDAEREGRIDVVTKGAPDVLLGRCTFERVGAEEKPLDDERRRQILAGVDRFSDRALRTIAAAYRQLPERDAPRTDVDDASASIERDLVYCGLVGILDPPRAEVASAIAEAQRAGVRVIMITGDHPRTAARIATSLGITAENAATRRGVDLDRLDEAGLRSVVREVSVFARVAPEHKLKIVDALQAEGHIVAMTGDGVNDAPALKSADIGVAMGIAGTEVTKEAAKMILADDNFATIVTAVREGRMIFLNIQKFLRYLLSSNIGEVLTMFFGVIAARPLGLGQGEDHIAVPLLATQILWINLLTDTAPALMLGVDPPAEDVMSKPPRSREDAVIDGPMLRGVLVTGGVMAAVTLLAIDWKLPGGLVPGSGDVTEARTAGFTVLVLAQLFNCFNARSETVSAFHGLFKNPLLWAAIGLSLLLQILVVHVPLLGRAMGTTPLSLSDWAVCAGLGSSVLWAGELKKLLGRARAARSTKGPPARR